MQVVVVLCLVLALLVVVIGGTGDHDVDRACGEVRQHTESVALQDHGATVRDGILEEGING